MITTMPEAREIFRNAMACGLSFPANVYAGSTVAGAAKWYVAHGAWTIVLEQFMKADVTVLRKGGAAWLLIGEDALRGGVWCVHHWG